MSTLLFIRKAVGLGVSAVPRLLEILSGGNAEAAEAAREALFSLVPAASLSLRRDSDGGAGRVVPAVIEEMNRGWIPVEDFASMCAEVLSGREEEGQTVFLERLAAFQGFEPAFRGELRSRGLAAAEDFYRGRVRELRRMQFPLQVSLSPTLACQLGCSYCVSAGVSPDASCEMPLSSVMSLLDWAGRQGVRRIGFTGGEPTLYSGFEEVIRSIRRRGMEWYLATNGLVAPRTLEAMLECPPLCVTLHLAPEIPERADATESFIRTALALADRKVPVAMRVNFDAADADLERMFGIARSAGIGEIRAAIPVPNAGRRNRFVDLERLDAFGELLGRFVRLAEARDIRPILAKPFFPCKLPVDALRTFLANGSFAINCPIHLNGYSNNVVVYPDMTYLPCLGLSLRSTGSLLDHDDLKTGAAVFGPSIKGLLEQTVLPECGSCALADGGRCIGVCPSYRLEEGAGPREP